MLQKINKNILIDHNINSFLLCGDPGCDGYNTEAVAIFEEILNEQADFVLLPGDLVPIGIPSICPVCGTDKFKFIEL